MNNINQTIKDYFKKRGIPLRSVAKILEISQSNLTNRLNSERSITTDELFKLINNYGDHLGFVVMKHYGQKVPFESKYIKLIEMLEHWSNYCQDLKELTDKISQQISLMKEMGEELYNNE